MQSQNGNQQRGQQGRPEAEAKPKVGEELIKQLMAERKREIMALFAKDENPEASYVRAVGFCVNAFRKVQADSKDRIDEYSVVAAGLWSIQRKLDPGTDVYFVPYKGRVTPIVSPQGVIKLAFRSGFVKAIDARPVFRSETFEYALGSERWVKHKKNNARPSNPREAWKELEYAYCIVDLKSGGQVIEVLDRADIEYYRSLSPTGSYDSSMWGKFPAEAARKAVLKQGLKFVPQESEISEILANDDTEKGIEIPDDIWDAVQKRGVTPRPENGAKGQSQTAPEEAPAERLATRGKSRAPSGSDPRGEGAVPPEEEGRVFEQTSGSAATGEPGED